jgi:hypothetical protein
MASAVDNPERDPTRRGTVEQPPDPLTCAMEQTRIGDPPASQVVADFVNRWAVLGSRFASNRSYDRLNGYRAGTLTLPNSRLSSIAFLEFHRELYGTGQGRAVCIPGVSRRNRRCEAAAFRKQTGSVHSFSNS